ncbi:hypothetical protein DRO37_02250 [Candidatus Bathyarchaeota archaeon]|nr:MAG: hypothetical protein DRO37_02250 [Candidatus Bathyarchaeota archaeon]
MDHSRTAVKPFLVYSEEPHNIKLKPDSFALQGDLPSSSRFTIDLQRGKSSAPTRDRELMII